MASAGTFPWWLGILVPPLVLYWLYGRLLLILALLRWRHVGIAGVLVYSSSPVWQPHIESEWLPELGGSLVTLNWSERKAWRASLPVLLWRHFAGGRHEFNPAVIVLRGLRQPLVLRFYAPFQLAKHGDAARLEALEREMFEAVRAAA